jgi:MFS family permease
VANRDLWLVGVSTLIFAGVQTVFLAFLVLYLHDVVRIDLVVAAKYLVTAQVSGAAGRIVFGLLSDRLFGGRRRIVLAIAGVGSIACALALSTTAPGSGFWMLAPLAVGIGVFGVGWNGVQHTLMAELAGPARREPRWASGWRSRPWGSRCARRSSASWSSASAASARPGSCSRSGWWPRCCCWCRCASGSWPPPHDGCRGVVRATCRRCGRFA